MRYYSFQVDAMGVDQIVKKGFFMSPIFADVASYCVVLMFAGFLFSIADSK